MYAVNGRVYEEGRDGNPFQLPTTQAPYLGDELHTNLAGAVSDTKYDL